MTPPQRTKCLAEIAKLDPAPYEDESFREWCREESDALTQKGDISPPDPPPSPSISPPSRALSLPPLGRYDVATAIQPTRRAYATTLPVTVRVYVYEFVSSEYSYHPMQTHLVE